MGCDQTHEGGRDAEPGGHVVPNAHPRGIHTLEGAVARSAADTASEGKADMGSSPGEPVTSIKDMLQQPWWRDTVSGGTAGAKPIPIRSGELLKGGFTSVGGVLYHVVFGEGGTPVRGRRVTNRWTPLEGLEHPDLETGGEQTAPSWSSAGTAHLTAKAGAHRRIIKQMAAHHSERPLPPPPSRPDRTDSAAYYKAAMLHLYHHDISVPVPKVAFVKNARSAFWARQSMDRRRFKGQKQDYLDIATASGERRMLVLQAPPTSLSGEAYAIHALQQATYRDDWNDRFAPALRTSDEAFYKGGFPKQDMTNLLYGHPLKFTHWPKPYKGRNHASCFELPERHSEAMQQYRSKGFTEGPLLYTPWVVNAMGGVYQPHKDKYRVVIDGTDSGLNGDMAKLVTEMDDLRVVLPAIEKDCYLSGLDMSDAFCNWCYTQTDSDCWGVQNPLTGEFDRYRVLTFGSSQSPPVQQRWATLLKQKAEEWGVTFLLTSGAKGSPAQVAGAFLDDFIIIHKAHLTQAEANEQFFAIVQFFMKLGCDLVPAKLELPAKKKEYIGYEINTEDCTVGFTAKRRAKLVQSIDEFTEEHRPAKPEVVDSGLVVLDLFGGIGTAVDAFAAAGHRIRKYFLCEIEPGKRETAARYAELVRSEHPGLFADGALDDMLALPQDVTALTQSNLQSLPAVDVLLAAWPCQGLSKANKGGGAGLNDHRSGLFWHAFAALKLLRGRNPDLLWLFENVPFGGTGRFEKDHRTVCGHLGEPLTFDAALVSAAHRVRSYWTNFPGASAPDTKTGPDWQAVLDDDHLAPGEAAKSDRWKTRTSAPQGTSVAAAPTVVKSADTWSERRGEAKVWNTRTSVWEQMRPHVLALLPKADGRRAATSWTDEPSHTC
jgi:hypothetical protein